MTESNAGAAARIGRRNWFTRFLDTVEWLGNLPPHPVTLFALLATAMVRGIVLNAPKHLVTVAVVFAGVISNTASEMGYVVLVPLAGMLRDPDAVGEGFLASSGPFFRSIVAWIFVFFWTGLFFLWVFGLDMPVGPGSPTYYTP